MSDEKKNKALMSLMMCPKLEDMKPPLFMALIIISESPSTITCSRFSSLAEHMALRAANTSTISTKVGNEIVCVKAATTRPLSFLTIASRLAKLFALKVAPSKLIFNQLAEGGSHLDS